MVQLSPREIDLDDVFGDIPDVPPVKNAMPPVVYRTVINPMTCAMVDLNDKSPSGIDKMVECLADIDAIQKNLEFTRNKIRSTIESLVDKATMKSNTQHVIGDKFSMTLGYPSRSFNNSGLKKIWAEMSEDAEAARANGREDEYKRITSIRSKFLRIDSVVVNMKEFKLYEAAAEAPREMLSVVDKIAKLEEKSSWPSFKIDQKDNGVSLNADSPIVVQKI